MTVVDYATPGFAFTESATFCRNLESGVPLVYFGGTRVVALSKPLGEVCDALAASTTPLDRDELTATLDQSHWNPVSVEKALQVLSSAGIVQQADATEATLSRSNQHLEFRRPFTIKLTLMNPETLCRRLSPLVHLFRGRLGLALSVLGAAIQATVWAIMLCHGNLTIGKGNGKPLLSVTFVLLTLTCLLHEMAHGAVLAEAGGHPQRLGIMLFYLVPSFFCDASDSFRLDRKSQVRVALAGVALQCQFGAVLSIFTLIPGPIGMSVGHFLGVNLLLVILNFLPFVALDGYFALRAIVGLPNLRAAAMSAWRNWVHTLMRRLGHSKNRGRIMKRSGDGTHQLPHWIIPYGAGATIMPILMVMWSLCAWTTRCWPNHSLLCLMVAVVLPPLVRALASVRRSVHR